MIIGRQHASNVGRAVRIADVVAGIDEHAGGDHLAQEQGLDRLFRARSDDPDRSGSPMAAQPDQADHVGKAGIRDLLARRVHQFPADLPTAGR